MKNKSEELIELNYLEIMDMEEKELMKYSKKDLIRLIWFQASCEHDLEKEVGRLKYNIE